MDACVLVNYSLCDTLLRVAEPPALFEPKWSAEIIEETVRALEKKLNWPAQLVDSLQRELNENFAEALVRNYEQLIPELSNDPKDRHVLAAAICSQSSVILTLNLKLFAVLYLILIRGESSQSIRMRFYLVFTGRRQS